MSVFKAGRVLAPDSKWTGEEPDWFGWETWPIEKFMRTKMRALNFYNYYLDASHTKPMVLDWMKSNKYTAADIDAIKNASPYVLPSTVGSLVRCMNRGMPPIHPDAISYYATLPFHDDIPPIPKNDCDIVKKEISTALIILNHAASLKKDFGENDINAAQTPKRTPIDRINEKIDKEIIPQLDALLDVWAKPFSNAPLLSMAGLLRDHKVPSQGCKRVLEWVRRFYDETSAALEKTCGQCVEGYSYLSKPELRKIVKSLETMMADIAAHSKNKMSMRKPRVKKIKDATKQVAKLKYQTTSAEYNVNSVSPTRLPLAQRVYTFNTKTKQIGVYYATGSSGFEVKGTSLKGYDLNDSFTATLRKPIDILNGILTSTPKRLDKIFDGVKLNKKKANGRFNEHTIILKVIEHKL